MADEDEFAGEKILERDQLFTLTNRRVGALLPGQPYVGSKTFFRAGAFMTGLHDSATCAGDYHETGFGNLASKIHALLVLHAGGLGARRAENRDFTGLGIWGEQFERVAQLALGGLDYLHLAARQAAGVTCAQGFSNV